MSTTRKCTLLAAATLAVWAVFSWPLPAHMFSGIPSGARNTEPQSVRFMVPGDHLQLLYHFQLAGDMAAGRIPLFHNLYEFNTGKDFERYEPGPYYVPFSLIHAGLAAVAGQAFGWNMTGLLALFATLWFTWRLVRRYVPAAPAAAAMCVVAILFPYRWVMLMGGSPTGFAMTWVPMMLLGLDIAVRDGKPRGGALAGLAVLLAWCTDLHVFFFSVLALPAWCVVAFAAIDDPAPARTRFCIAYGRRTALALLPAAALVFMAYLLSRVTAGELADATMAGGWPLKEVASYSPRAAELMHWTGQPPLSAVYVGYALPAVLLAGLLLLGVRAARRRPGAGRMLVVLSLLCAGILVAIALTLGTNGPLHGLPLRICRAVLPPYRMIRQPAKAFCLLPSLLSVAAAMALAALTSPADPADPADRERRIVRGRLWGGLRGVGRCSAPSRERREWAVCLGLCALVFLEYRLPLRTAVCLLDRKQDAYAAVVADARQHSRPPLVMIIPLWPGESHWSSLYQHEAAMYRIRMMNGYRPAVPKSYIREVFEPFESLNQGILSGAQLDNLLERGCEYLLLHEDAFPEKVSPFPVCLTLKRLLTHPRLELLKQDERVRAFRTLPAPHRLPGEEAPVSPPLYLPYLFPARQWNLKTPLSGQFAFQPRAPIGGAPGLRWSILLRGRGAVNRAQYADGEPAATGRIDVVSGESWQWHDIDIVQTAPFFTPRLTLAPAAEPRGQAVELDCCVLNAGPRPVLAPGQSLDIPAACFFHAGYSDAGLRTVTFLKEKDPALPLLYGSFVELPDGRYRLSAELQTAAPRRARLGGLRVLTGAGTLAQEDVVAGEPAVIELVQHNEVPVRVEFCYSGAYDIELGMFRLTRVPGDD